MAEPWLLLTLGASPFIIGLDSFAMNAPVWLLTLAGGILADRADRRRVATLFRGRIQMPCSTAIVVLLLLHRIQPWQIIAFSVVVGITDALSMPSFQSIVPSIVPHEQIGAGLALNSTQFNLSRILGPSIAGLLMSGVGAIACFVVSAVSYIPFIGVALWILPRRTPAPPAADAPPRTKLFAGIRDILRQRTLRGALLSVLATAVLCGPLITFVPVLVRDGFQGGAGHFSLALVAFGAGGLLGAAALASMPATVDRRRLSIGFALAQGMALILVALDPWFWGLLPLLVLAGGSMTIGNTAANTLLQLSADPRLLGRTVSLYMLALRGGIALGALVGGLTVTVLGVRHALLASGAVAIVVQVVVGRMWLRAAGPTGSPA